MGTRLTIQLRSLILKGASAALADQAGAIAMAHEVGPLFTSATQQESVDIAETLGA